MPVAHLEVNESGDTRYQYYAPEDLGVKLQHVPEYKYIEQCPKNKFLEEFVARKRKEDEERKEEEKREAEEASVREEEERLMVTFSKIPPGSLSDWRSVFVNPL